MKKSVTFKSIEYRNLLSYGNNWTYVNLDQPGNNLIIGENRDIDDEGSRNGVGKAQPLYSGIKTPIGWKLMGDMRVGDEVSTPDGKSAKVTNIFPQGSIDTYRIHFSDGRHTDCCGDHLWKVYSNRWTEKDKVLPLKDIIPLLDNYEISGVKRQKNYVYVPLLTDNTDSDIDLPMDPWLLGFLIGDGSFRTGTLTYTTQDEFVVNAIDSKLADGYYSYNQSNSMTYRITDGVQSPHNSYIRVIRDLGLWNHKSEEKFIPTTYKDASIKQKLQLLSGLIDADGYVSKTGNVSLSTSSKDLADDVVQIVRSIGGIATISTKYPTYKHNGKFSYGQLSYIVRIRYSNPRKLVTLPRKLDRISDNYQYSNLKLRIDKIEYIGKHESQCIMIDHPDHLYVTDDYIVTHNSTMFQAVSLGTFNKPITKIKVNNLVNATNKKQLEVKMTFVTDWDNTTWIAHWGQKPDFVHLYKNEEAEENDVAPDSKAEVVKKIEDLLGIDFETFKYVVLFTATGEPFLDLGATKQREIIESLFNMDIISEKAAAASALKATLKKDVEFEEKKIKLAVENNERIQKTIAKVEADIVKWDEQREVDINEMRLALKEIDSITDEVFEKEIDLHAGIAELREDLKQYKPAEKELNRNIDRFLKDMQKLIDDMDHLRDDNCPFCKQSMPNAKDKLIELNDKYNELADEYGEVTEQHELIVSTISEAEAELQSYMDSITYDSIDELKQLRSQKDAIITEIERAEKETNPYIGHLDDLKNTMLQEIDESELMRLQDEFKHADFLLKLLNNKNSFIRKRIIGQVIPYMNERLSYYIDKLGLPHSVQFEPDLTASISQFGRELSFGNLSTGERQRVNLALSFAFRDVLSNMHTEFNILLLDEVLDAGLDEIGVYNTVNLLNDMVKEKNMSIFLISHRAEVGTMVDNTITVVKQDGFSGIEYD